MAYPTMYHCFCSFSEFDCDKACYEDKSCAYWTYYDNSGTCLRLQTCSSFSAGSADALTGEPGCLYDLIPGTPNVTQSGSDAVGVVSPLGLALAAAVGRIGA